MDKAIVKTDIQIAVPHGCYGRVGKCHASLSISVVFVFLLANFFFFSFQRQGLD